MAQPHNQKNYMVDTTNNSAGNGGKQAPSKGPYDITLGDLPPNQRELPIVQVFEGQIAQAVNETEEQLIKAGKPVFKRGGTLMTPIWTDRPTAIKGHFTRTTVLVRMDIGMLRYMLNNNFIRFLKHDARRKRLVEVDPPDKVMHTLLTHRVWKFPEVNGLSNNPTLRPDGSIVSAKGFDAATGRYLQWEDDLVLPPIADHPTRAEAEAALKLLTELLVGFPFKEKLDEAVAVAAILTAVTRGAFDIAPMFLITASASGTGKSFLVDTISTIVSGRRCPVTSASDNKDEMEKRIGALLLESPPLISLDNLTSDLEGELLCQMCTQHTVKPRILGKSETPDCEWRGSMFATGNNIGLINDMVRRGLECRIYTPSEEPEARPFDFDPLERVLEDRGKYIHAALTIVRAYITSGEKMACIPYAGYGEWSAIVREALLWLKMQDPMLSVKKSRAKDPNRIAAKALIEQLKNFPSTDEKGKPFQGERGHQACQRRL
jgi:putative DNA primase/helicase